MVQGDATAGAKLFKSRCSQCHTVEEGCGHKQGPNLHDIFGRKTSQASGYSCTEANLQKDITWNEETLHMYLERPKKFIFRTKMVFAGFKKEKDRAYIIAYLKHLKNS
jgi:cytochrome c